MLLAVVIVGFNCATAITPRSNGHPTIETFTLTSRTFGNTRTIRILLPPDYHHPRNARSAYPVLYLNDGVMVFKKSGIDIEGVVDASMRQHTIPPIIVVGVDNGASTDTTTKDRDDRAMEYLPYPDAGFPTSHRYAPDPAEPHGKLYPAFLCDEVMPAVAARYRVLGDPVYTGVGGVSYGGVAALYAAIARPGCFGKLLIESAPLWIGKNQELLADARKVRGWPSRVYAGVGTAESQDAEINAEGRKDLDELLGIIRQTSPTAVTKVVVEDNAHHSPAAWRHRLPSALEFLFEAKKAADGGLN